MGLAEGVTEGTGALWNWAMSTVTSKCSLGTWWEQPLGRGKICQQEEDPKLGLASDNNEVELSL